MLLRSFKTKGVFIIFMFCTLLAIFGCSQPANIPQNSQNIEPNSLISRPVLALSFSEAIVHGMRRLMNDLLISESWFKDMDISILSNNGELLKARITDFKMHEDATFSLFSSWTIYLVSNETLEYVTSFKFTSTNEITNDSQATAKRDSLFLNIPHSTFKSLLGENTAPANIQIVYWRNFGKRDKVASLHMVLGENSKYSIKI